MRRIYVAGPYSADNIISALDNIREGMRWSTKVMLAGYAPFCPWQDFHFQLMLRDGERLTVSDYYEYSLAWLRVSDAMLVIPNWEASKGTRREIEEAKAIGIPIVYANNGEGWKQVLLAVLPVTPTSSQSEKPIPGSKS